MKILFVHNFFSKFGGAEETVMKEFNQLKQRGHDVFFFAVDKKPYIDENYKYSKYFPQYIDYSSLSGFESLKYSLKSFYNTEAEKNITRLLDEIKPDIVKFHNIFYYLTPSIINACHKRNIPMIMTLHDPKIACPSRTLLLNNKIYCRDELCVGKSPIHCLINRCKYGSLKASLLVTVEYLFNKYLNITDKISYFICPSEAIRKLAHKSGIKNEKLIVINHFLEDSKFTNIPEYKNKGYFLYVGRLSNEKGVDYLIKAMKQLPPNVNLHIIGRGPEEGSLKKLSGDLRLQNIKFLGYKYGKELDEQYANCIATIQPCNWFETFGRTVIESFIHGKPVIASNIGALPELIDNDKTGYIFEPGNNAELSALMNKIYHDKNLVIQMGKNARLKVEKDFNSDIYYSKMLGVFNKLVKTGNSKQVLTSSGM